MKLLKLHYAFLILIFAAFLIRIFLALFTLQPQFKVNDDLRRYEDWGRISYQYGLADSYDLKHITFGALPNTVPPGSTYIDFAVYSIYHTVFHDLSSKQFDIYAFFLKLPPIMADLAIGLFIYFCVYRYQNKKYALLASSLFLYNPVVIYNSAVWGQTDAIINCFSYLSLLLLLSKKYFFSIFAILLSIYVKLSLLPLLPLILLLALKGTNYNYKKIFLFTVTSIAAMLIFTLPVSNSPFFWLVNFFIQHSSGELPHIVNYAFNFWSVIFNPDYFANIPLSSQIFYGLSLNLWAYIIYFTAFIPLLFWVMQNKTLDTAKLFGTCALITFAMFLFLPRMHERYLYSLFPLFATYIGLRGKYYVEFLLVTLLNFIGLYVTWHPSDFLPTLITGIIVHSKARLGMSLLIVLLFIVLFARIVFKKENLKSFFRKIYPLKGA